MYSACIYYMQVMALFCQCYSQQNRSQNNYPKGVSKTFWKSKPIQNGLSYSFLKQDEVLKKGRQKVVISCFKT